MIKKLLLASAFLSAITPALTTAAGAAATIDPRQGPAWPIGNKDQAGPCLELIKWHPNHFSHPHYHNHARYAVVIEGTWWVSTSTTYDPANLTVPFPKGSVLTDLVKGTHYDGAKPETGDATIAIFMDCPLDAVSTEVKK
jgi:hypothetical protein